MDRVKFMVTFLAIAGAMLGGYFLIQNNMGEGVANDGSDTNKLSLETALKNAEENGTDGSEFGPKKGVTYIPTNPGNNITRLVAQSMFSKMQQLDAQGDSPFNGVDPTNANAMAMIDDTIRNVPETIFKSEIDTKDVIITKDNSRAAKMRYIEGIDRITKARFVGSAGDKFKIESAQVLIDNFKTDCVDGGSSAKNAEMSKGYLEIYNDYKKLTTPSSWLAMHKLILGHFKELSDIYGAFGQCKDDPIRAYVGMQKLPEVYDRTADIQKIINAKAVELGIH